MNEDIDEILLQKYKTNQHNRDEQLINNFYSLVNKHLSIILLFCSLFLCFILGYFLFLYIITVDNNDKLQQAKGFMVPAIVLVSEKIRKK